MKKRNQIDNKYKWNLNDIYENDSKLKADIESLKVYPDKLAMYKGKLKNVKKCLEFFKLSTEVSKLVEKIQVYLGLRLAENLENTQYQELSSVVSYIAKNLSVATSFEESELLSYGEKYIKKLIRDERFAVYKIALLDFLRNKAHILSEEKEILLSKAMRSLGGFSEVFDNIDTLDLKYQDAMDSKKKMHEVNQHNYSELMESKDRV